MPTLSAGQTASIVLAPGDSYTVSTTANFHIDDAVLAELA